MSSFQFLGQELKGVWDATGGAVVGLAQSVASGEAESNIATTAKLAVTNPGAIVEAGREAVHEVGQTLNAAASGDPRAIGQVVGTLAVAASAVKDVQTRAYPGAGGGGVHVELRTGGSVRFDVHRLHFGDSKIPVRNVPHIDANLFGGTIKHFPFGPWTN